MLHFFHLRLNLIAASRMITPAFAHGSDVRGLLIIDRRRCLGRNLPISACSFWALVLDGWLLSKLTQGTRFGARGVLIVVCLDKHEGGVWLTSGLTSDHREQRIFVVSVSLEPAARCGVGGEVRLEQIARQKRSNLSAMT